MEKSYKDYVKVGFFVIAITVLGLWGYFWISSQKRVKGTVHYFVKMPRATLVSTGTKVLLLGIPVGSVESVEFSNNGVLLKIVLKDVKLKEGAIAQVITPSALGTRMIDITPGEGNYLKSGDTIYGRDSPTFDEMLFLAKDMEERLNGIIMKVETILYNVNILVNQTNTNLNDISQKFSYTLENVNNILDSLKTISTLVSNANMLVLDTRKLVEKLNTEIDSISDMTKSLIVSLDSVKTQGSIGKLMYDDEFYQELLKTLESLNQLVEDLKKNPSKYIKISVF